MTDSDNNTQLWPSAAYDQQLSQLRQAIGEPIFLAELRDTAINAGVKFSDQPLTLLSIVDYPQPDPYRQLCPHMLVLDDGRGVNLGRVVRVSRKQAFGPTAEDILFCNTEFIDGVLLAPRTLSRESIAATSHELLSRMLGDEPGRLLKSDKNDNDHATLHISNNKHGYSHNHLL